MLYIDSASLENTITDDTVCVWPNVLVKKSIKIRKNKKSFCLWRQRFVEAERTREPKIPGSSGNPGEVPDRFAAVSALEHFWLDVFRISSRSLVPAKGLTGGPVRRTLVVSGSVDKESETWEVLSTKNAYPLRDLPNSKGTETSHTKEVCYKHSVLRLGMKKCITILFTIILEEIRKGNERCKC